MPGAGAIEAGAAFVRIFAKDDTATGINSVAGHLKAIGTAALGVATAAAAAVGLGTSLFGAARQFADVGSQLHDMAGRTGATVEGLQTLGYAAEQSGASLGDIEIGMRRMAKAGKSAGKSTEQAFRGALREVAAIPDPMARSQKALELFGRSGTRLVPVAMELDELEKRARRLEIVMSTTDADSADALGDALADLNLVFRAITLNIGAAVAPALATFAKLAADAVGGLVPILSGLKPAFSIAF